MSGFNWVISTLSSLFGLLNTQVLGVPMYIYPMCVFILGLLANFMQGRR